MEEVFWPFLNEFSEGEEVEDAGVFIDDGIAIVVVFEEVVDLFDDELLNLLFAVGLVALCVEVEDVGVGGAAFLKDVDVVDGLVIFIEDLLHFLVEVGVVVGHEGFVAVVTLDQLRTVLGLHSDVIIIYIWSFSIGKIHLLNMY